MHSTLIMNKAGKKSLSRQICQGLMTLSRVWFTDVA